MMAGLGCLTWSESVGFWGWVSLHTCCTLSNRCAQVQPAINHTHRSAKSPAGQHVTPPALRIIPNRGNKPSSPPCVLVSEEPGKSPPGAMWQPQQTLLKMYLIGSTSFLHGSFSFTDVLCVCVLFCFVLYENRLKPTSAEY